MNRKTIILCSLLATVILAGGVYATGEIEVTDGSYYFYGTNDPAFESGYFASIEVDGKVYYFDDSTYDKMCEYDSNFATGLLTQFPDSDSVDIKNAAGFKVGSLSSEKTVDPFSQSVGKSFSFDFEKGEVGFNKDANIIKTVYDDSGNKL